METTGHYLLIFDKNILRNILTDCANNYHHMATLANVLWGRNFRSCVQRYYSLENFCGASGRYHYVVTYIVQSK